MEMKRLRILERSLTKGERRLNEAEKSLDLSMVMIFKLLQHLILEHLRNN
jgi:hypothetical protein